MASLQGHILQNLNPQDCVRNAGLHLCDASFSAKAEDKDKDKDKDKDTVKDTHEDDEK